jgi:pilus assembly protein CpaE
MASELSRVLVIHPHAETRRSVERALRSVGSATLSIYEAASLSQGFESARTLDPEIVLLDLGEERELALDVARGLRTPERAIVGLYNPLVLKQGELDFFRAAARAGVSDFVPLPVAEPELREALESASRSRQTPGRPPEGRVVTFYSPKGGVGRTTLAVNTAVVLSASDLTIGEVALCDADLQFGNAAAHLGLVPDHDLADLAGGLEGLQTLSTHFANHAQTHLHLLASPRDPIDADRVTPEQMSRVLIALRRRFEVVVVDAPSLLDLMSLALLDLSDLIFLVTEPVAPTVLSTARCLDLLQRQGIGGGRIEIVLNRAGEGAGQLAERLIDEQLGRPIEHRVPEDRSLVAALNRGEPAVVAKQQGPFAEAISDLAQAAVRPRRVAAVRA